jgi:hypothetical protein
MEVLKVFKVVPKRDVKINNLVLHIVLSKVIITDGDITKVIPWFDVLEVKVCCTDLNRYDINTLISISDMYSSDYVIMAKVVNAIMLAIIKKHGGTPMSNGDVLL